MNSFVSEVVPAIMALKATHILSLSLFLSQKDNSSILYLFSKDQEPSFKLVEQVIPSVQTLSKNVLELTFEPFNYKYLLFVYSCYR